MLVRQRAIDKRQTRFKLESALMALALALGMCFTAGRAYASPTADNNWEGASYYQGFQGASTYVPDNAGRAALETYGIWMDEPAGDGTFIDDVIVTDTSKYVAETVDLSALDSGLTGDALWKAVNKSPAYYYNIITRPYDATAPIAFQWERQGPGGNNGAYGGMGAYVKIYSSLDENGLGKDLVAPCVESQFQYNKDFAQHYSNWVTGFRWTLPANALEAGKTYYLVFEQGCTMGNGGTLGRSLSANIVFEFTTDTSQQAINYLEGQDIVTPYYAKQGGAAIVDLTEPNPRHITTNLTVSRNTKSFCNDIASYVDAANPKFTFVLSGSNSQQFSEAMAKQVAYPNIHIYAADGVGVGSDAVSLDPGKIVASWSDDDQSDMDFVFTDKIAPTYLTVKNGVLESGKDYYLVFESACGVSTNSKLEKPVLFRFTTGDVADTSALDSALEKAHADLEATMTSADGTDVPSSSKWVAPEAYDAFEAAVVAAQQVRDSLNPTQSAVDGALSALADAQAAFTAAQQDGTYLDTAKLASALEAANAAKVGVAASADGTDVSRGTYWVTADALDAFQSAIDAAQAVLDNENATQDEVDAAVAPLEGATSAFNAAKAYGSKAREAGETFFFTDEIGTWTCRIDDADAGEVTITAMSSPSQAGKDVVIPSSVTSGPDAFTVTALGDGASMGGGQAAGKILTSAKTLTIPSTVKTVNGYAFYALQTSRLIFPEDSQLETIEKFGFSRLGFRSSELMEELVLPASIVTIGDDAFDRIDWCKKIDLSKCTKLKSVGTEAFSGTTEGSHVESIDFSNCAALETIGKWAFTRAAVSTLDLSPLVSLNTIDSMAFAEMPNLESIVVPSGVTTIGSNAFYLSPKLKTVDVSLCEGLTTLDACSQCESLETVKLPSTVTTVTFSKCPQLANINLPASTISVSFTACPLIAPDTLDMPSPQTLQSLTIADNPNVTSIDLAKFTGLTSCSFSGCTALVEAKNVPASLTNWTRLFNKCSSLSKPPEIPSGVTTLDYAFSGTAIEATPSVPGTVATMRGTFSSCKQLADASAIPSSVTNISALFDGCSSLAQVPAIPENVTDASYAFRGTAIIASPTIPEGVKSVTGMFSDCQQLTEAPVIPASATKLTQMFSGCTSLEKAPEIPGTVVGLESTFAGCTSLKESPVLPEGLTGMVMTFEDSGIVEAPLIPSTVTSMFQTFYGCSSLVHLPDGFTIPCNLGSASNAFYVESADGSKVDITIYAPADDKLVMYNWAKDNRALKVLDAGAAKIGGAHYDTLAVAVDAVADGQTVALLADNAEEVVVSRAVSFTLDENGFAFTGAVKAGPGFEAVEKDGVYTVSPVDMGALRPAVDGAKVAMADVAVSADGTDVASNKTWVTEKAMGDLAKAVADAEAVLAQEAPRQADVDAAVQAIADAKAAFKPAAGTKAVDGDVSDLAASAAAAKAAREGVASSADGTDVESTKTWVGADVAQALDDAVAAAEALAKQENPDQAEVDVAAKALADALAAFKPAAGTMAASASVDALNDAVASAAAAADGVVVSIDGSDVTSDKTWATKSAKDALDKAIADAKALAEQDKPSQADVDASAKALADAKAAFRPVAGLKASQAAISGLTGAADEAEAARKGVAVDTDASHVDKGASWVTQDVADALDAAIDAARAVAADPNATQAEVDAASLQLNKALAAFDAAKQAGTKGSGSGAATDPGEGGAGSGGSATGGTPPSSQGGGASPLVKTGDGVPAAPLVVAALVASAAVCIIPKKRLF